MKQPFYALALLLLAACSNNSAPQKNAVSMPGVYKMVYQQEKTSKKDTTTTSLQQVKIYTDGYMMFANYSAPDSVGNFAVGSYTMAGDTLTENVFYGAGDTVKSADLRSFKLYIEKTDSGYKQIIPEIESEGEKSTLTEGYDRIGKPDSTAVDGLWELQKAMWIIRKDTVPVISKQFKMYYQGHFIWGHTYEDSLKKTHTGIGYGTFTMSAPGKLKESATTSTSHYVRGLHFDIAVQLDGPDAFTQTITEPDSSRSVEYYKRVKR